MLCPTDRNPGSLPVSAFASRKEHSYNPYRLREYRIDDPYRVRLYFEFCLSMRLDNDVIMRQNRFSAILSAYEMIFFNYDEPVASDTFERAYMAYGLYGVFLKWARDGYRQTVADMTSMFLALHGQSDIIE